MKAIELLEIVNENCTPNESYLIYRNVVKPAISGQNDKEIMLFMWDFFLGTDGIIIHIDFEKLKQAENVVVIYPTIVEVTGEFYHDFAPNYEESLFEGKLDNGQLVYIFNLE